MSHDRAPTGDGCRAGGLTYSGSCHRRTSLRGPRGASFRRESNVGTAAGWHVRTPV